MMTVPETIPLNKALLFTSPVWEMLAKPEKQFAIAG